MIINIYQAYQYVKCEGEFKLSNLNLKQIILDYIRCFKSRKEVIIIYTWTSLVGLFIVSVFVVMSLTGMAVYFYNDFFDYEDDIISREEGNTTASNRPLGQELVSKKRMAYFIIFNGVIGLSLAYFINLTTFLLMSSYVILGFLYSTKPFILKKRKYMKQLTISLGGAIACSLGGFVSGSFTPNLLFFTVMSFFMFFGVNPIIDLRDMDGDKAMGVPTFPVLMGPLFTVRLAIVTLTASMLANIVGYYQFGFSTALPVLGGIVLIGTILVIRPLLDNWGNT